MTTFFFAFRRCRQFRHMGIHHDDHGFVGHHAFGLPFIDQKPFRHAASFDGLHHFAAGVPFFGKDDMGFLMG